jgi:hypothetical protein
MKNIKLTGKITLLIILGSIIGISLLHSFFMIGSDAYDTVFKGYLYFSLFVVSTGFFLYVLKEELMLKKKINS